VDQKAEERERTINFTYQLHFLNVVDVTAFGHERNAKYSVVSSCYFELVVGFINKDDVCGKGKFKSLQIPTYSNLFKIKLRTF
jgi:hypothetical protein